jgi:hypothetical protein
MVWSRPIGIGRYYAYIRLEVVGQILDSEALLRIAESVS